MNFSHKLTKQMKYKLIISNGILTRNVDTQKHYWIKFRAYSFDEEELKELKGQWHQLRIVTSTGRVYSISESEFYKQSQINKDYGKEQRLIQVKFLKLEQHRQTLINVSTNFHTRLKEKSTTTNKPMNQIILDLFNNHYGDE